MQIVDTNVLLYAINEDSPKHEESIAWLDSALLGNESVGFAWAVMLVFLRLSTRRAVFPQPLTWEQASSALEEWLAQPAAVVVEPSTRHLSLFRGMLMPFGSAGNLVADAHLAVLSIEHGARVITYDNDFGRFPGVRWEMPQMP